MVGKWVDTTLGDVLTLQRGFDLPESEREPGSHPVIASMGPVGTHTIAMVRGPGVVIGRSGSLGGGQFIQSDFWPLNTTLWVKDFKGNDKRFCYYLLKSLDLAHFNAGSGVPTLNRNHIHPLPVRIPKDLNEQGAIAHILGTLDDKIELNRKMNETLEAMARAIFKSWFIDFDPVPGLGHHKEWQESPLGKIPKGWRVGAIGDIADIVGGSTPSTKESTYWEPALHYWATPKDLSGLPVPVLITTERKISDAGLAQISSGLLSAGTVLLSSRAPIGYLAIAEVPVAINQGFIAMRPKAGISNLFLLLWAAWAHDEILSRANGSTFLEISKVNFRPILLMMPPRSVMETFDVKARPLYQQIVANERESRTLAAIRDTLLPKLLSGEIRVKNAERFVEEIA